MSPTFCERCQKNIAVAFVRKPDDTAGSEAICLICARKAGISQVDELMKRMGITDEDLEAIQRDTLKAMTEME